MRHLINQLYFTIIQVIIKLFYYNKMATYFQLLPIELKLALSLYLNYRDTLLACEFLKCENAEFWINKIRNELGFTSEFVKEYIYDSTTQTIKTLLPLNEKYLELKARTSLDFGVEFYQSPIPILYHMAQLKDFSFVDEFFAYYSRFINDMSLQEVSSIENNLKLMIKEAARTGNTQLIDKVALMAYRKIEPHAVILPEYF